MKTAQDASEAGRGATIRAHGAQSSDQRAPVERALGWVAAGGAVLSLARWMAVLSAEWLFAAATGALVWTLLCARHRDRFGVGGAALLWLAVGMGAGVQLHLQRIATDWPEVREGVQRRAAAALRADLDQVVDRGEQATGALVSAAAETKPREGNAGLFARAQQIQANTGVSAVAIYGPDGDPFAWAGEHRGKVPAPVRRGEEPYSFAAGPLFRYVYFTRPFGDGNTAAAAVLLEGTISVGDKEAETPFATRFAQRQGLRPRFTLPEQARGGAVWDWTVGDTPILSAAFAALTQEGWRSRLAARGRLAEAVVVSLVLGLLLLGWYRTRAGPPALPIGVVTAGLLIAPLRDMTGQQELFSPAQFVLPFPGDISLGQLLIVLAGCTLWYFAGRRGSGPNGWAAWLLRAAAAALLLPAVLALIRSSAASSLLASEPAGGIPLLVCTALAVALVLLALLGRGPVQASPSRTRAASLVALSLAVALGAALVVWWSPGRSLPVWAPSLWAVPFAVLGLVPPVGGPRRELLLPWMAVGWLGGTLALSHLWILHQTEQLAAAEEQLAHLGTEPDPFLEFLLQQFAERVLEHAADGEGGVVLLYRSWVTGGLAAEGYEAQIALWNEGRLAAELRLAEVALPANMPELLRRARDADEPIVQRFSALDSLHYLLLVPLPGGRVVSVAVPPRRSLGRSTPLARFLNPAGAREPAEADAAVSLMPIRPGPGHDVPHTSGWTHTPEGWRSEVWIPFPEGPLHAHLLVRVPTDVLLATRALLFQGLLLGLLILLWALGRGAGGRLLRGGPAPDQWIRSFRGQLTLALFGFFLLPLLLMAATVYRALTREVVRTAEAVAQHALGQAVRDAPGLSLGTLAEHVGVDLLLYRGGVLRGAAAPEVLELGLYPAWLPPSAYLLFHAAEGTVAEQERRLGDNEYLIAYRRLGSDQVLAAPTPLAAGEIARRRRDLADTVLLAVLLGAGLSVVLSLAVGRALSRPIERLSAAAAAVGAGDLSVRMEGKRRDEFGGLFESFNLMVASLREARAALLRETRRTDAILAEAGTGILALDGAGRVRLMNPRASEILGVEVPTGESLPRTAPVSVAVAEAVDRFRRSAASEQSEEIESEALVLRLRLRRLSPGVGSGGGMVAALEDVSASIRSARVLAWGEMARQVAHEIKNPLTPIKLSVQHLRRAYADRRTDFEQILERNVEVILAEIDRLGEIARAFARFGTPAPAPAALEAVDVAQVVEDVLGLYRSGGDGIRFASEVIGMPPPVFARPGELKEVLVNLFENARAALPEGGDLALRVADAEPGWVRLDVRDSGVGIPPELLPRIWDPHFSTRSSGTGLGLAIVRRLVEGWGGEVDAESRPGEGTVVRVRLRTAG